MMELLPCPFCGELPTFTFEYCKSTWGNLTLKCCISTVYGAVKQDPDLDTFYRHIKETKIGLKNIWNTRYTPQCNHDEIEAYSPGGGFYPAIPRCRKCLSFDLKPTEGNLK